MCCWLFIYYIIFLQLTTEDKVQRMNKEIIQVITPTVKSDNLWDKLKASTQRAIECGALHSIPTEYEFVEQDGIKFLVRILSNLVRKEEAKKKQETKTTTDGKEFNPFLPYDKDLFVADLSDSHVCVLNKFNVVDYHLLIITREFEEQENWLTLADFTALWKVLTEIDGLAFYNGGKLAGASQRHKHLQLVPLPLTEKGPKIPIEPALAKAVFCNGVGTIPLFNFSHAFALLDIPTEASREEAAKKIRECYYTLLGAVGLTVGQEQKQTGPYNFLATREWMLIIKRSHEEIYSISVNSLGFAGALLVRNQEIMQIVKDLGPLTILSKVAQD